MSLQARIQHYDFEVEYGKVERLKHADLFSRNHVSIIMNLTTDDDLLCNKRHDPDLDKIIESKHLKLNLHPEYVARGGVFRFKMKTETRFLKSSSAI